MTEIKRFYPSQTIDPNVQTVMQRLLEQITEKGDLSSAGGYDDISGYDYMNFIDDAFDLMKQYQAATSTLKDFSLEPAYVYHDVGSDVGNAIRWSMVRRTPASWERTNKFHTDGVRNVKWTLLEILDDTENPGYKVLVYQKQYENTIDFISWSKNYRDANMGAMFLEDFFDTYGNLLKSKGLEFLAMESRMSDLFREAANFSLYGIPMRYNVRTNKIKLVYEHVLENLTKSVLISK